MDGESLAASRNVTGSFAAYAPGNYPWDYTDDFEAGLVANTNLGGDNCHRGAVLGALVGAAAGTGQIPARFCDGLHNAAALRRRANPFVG